MENPVEEREEGLGKPEGPRVTSENSQKQLNRLIGAFQKLNHQSENLHGIDLGPVHIFYSCVARSFCRSPIRGSRDCIWLGYLLLESFTYIGWPPLALTGGIPILPTSWCALTGLCMGDLPFAVEEGVVAWGRREVWRDWEKWEKELCLSWEKYIKNSNSFVL